MGLSKSVDRDQVRDAWFKSRVGVLPSEYRENQPGDLATLMKGYDEWADKLWEALPDGETARPSTDDAPTVSPQSPALEGQVSALRNALAKAAASLVVGSPDHRIETAVEVQAAIDDAKAVADAHDGLVTSYERERAADVLGRWIYQLLEPDCTEEETILDARALLRAEEAAWD